MKETLDRHLESFWDVPYAHYWPAVSGLIEVMRFSVNSSDGSMVAPHLVGLGYDPKRCSMDHLVNFLALDPTAVTFSKDRSMLPRTEGRDMQAVQNEAVTFCRVVGQHVGPKAFLKHEDRYPEGIVPREEGKLPSFLFYLIEEAEAIWRTLGKLYPAYPGLLAHEIWSIFLMWVISFSGKKGDAKIQITVGGAFQSEGFAPDPYGLQFDFYHKDVHYRLEASILALMKGTNALVRSQPDYFHLESLPPPSELLEQIITARAEVKARSIPEP